MTTETLEELTRTTTMTTMKAVVQHGYGPLDALELEDVEKPAIGDDDVLVRVHAAGVNWADWALARGVPYMLRLGYGLRRPRNPIRGTDVAGTVEATGGGIEQLRPGDEVFGWCQGAFAEYVVAKETNLVAKPADITFAQAAAVPMAGFVALQALRDVGEVGAGQKVLVNGASGGIGTFTVQIAKALGAEVTGVCSTGNLDLVQSIGADHVIDYIQEDFTRGDECYDFILDIADDHTLSERRQVLTPKGTLVPNSGEGNRLVGSLGRIIKARLVSPFVSQKLHPFLSLPKHEDLVELKGLIESGDITPIIDRSYPLDETPTAIRHAGSRHASGKVVVVL